MLKDFTIDDLRRLREEIKEIFLDYFKKELYVSGYVGNPFYTDLNTLIEKTLGLDEEGMKGIPKEGVFIKLFNKDELNYHPSTIRFFKDLVKAYKSLSNKIPDETNNSATLLDISHYTNFKGAQLIDIEFRERMENPKFKYTYTDFYLLSYDNDCQWFGIVKDWDIPRPIYQHIRDEAFRSFSRNSKVSLVVYGAGATGKTTMLRRLAMDLIHEKLKVLWLLDLSDFVENDFNSISKSEDNYLLFIEDWTNYEQNTALVSSFLNKASSSKNLRIIIGDRKIEQKEYCKYIYGNNSFELPNDNSQIIQGVLLLNSEWKDRGSELLNQGFHNAPLYLIFFVIARSLESDDNSKTNDLLSRFKEIIEHDIEMISKQYNGLALALYYTSAMNSQYKVNITWESFLIIADHFNGNNIISSRFFQLEGDNEINKILLRYITKRQVLHPHSNYHSIVLFHHDFMADELSKITLRDWNKFDNTIQIEISKLLIEKEQFFSMVDYYMKLNPALKEHGLTISKLVKLLFPSLVVHNNFFRYMLRSFGVDEVQRWQNKLELHYKNSKDGNSVFWLEFLISALFITDYSNDNIILILKKIIENGCENKLIKDTYDDFLNDKSAERLLFLLDIVGTTQGLEYLVEVIVDQEENKNANEKALQAVLDLNIDF